MLKWDPQAVASFLQCQAEFQDNSSYLFTFLMLGGVATLRVFPDNGEVALDVSTASQPEAATWRLECSAISFNDEIPEEGGPCLVFAPASRATPGKPLDHWVVLARRDNAFQILTVFYVPEE